MEVGLLVAFFGGALALLSPCGALLLPSFFATTVDSGGKLVLHSGVFFVGLVTTLAPLGLGAALLGATLARHRDVLILGAGWLIVVFGLMTALGLGFDLQRIRPRASAARLPRPPGLLRSFLMGTVAGIAGFCAGPILGAVLTMAAAAPPLVGAATLVVYAAGMVVPLFAIAVVWRRLGVGGRSVLRGRELTLGPVTTHTTSLASGTLLVVVGILFLRTNGLAALPNLIPAAALARAQVTVTSIGAAVPDVALIVAVALIALAVWWWSERRRLTDVERRR